MVVVSKRALEDRQMEAWLLHLAARLPVPWHSIESNPQMQHLRDLRERLSPTSRMIFDFLVDEKKLPANPDEQEFYQTANRIRREARSESGARDDESI